jgi:hypothetical protein
MPNGTTIQSSHTCNLFLTNLQHQARQAHILPGLVHNSLISVGQLCDNECSVTFTQDQVTVSRNGKDVMYRSRDPKSRLWRVNLKQKIKPEIVQCNHAYDNNNQKDLINYLHAVCFSPVKSTWIKVIKLLNYCNTHPETKIRYHASDMILHIHSDVSYLSENEAKSRAGGFFYMGDTTKNDKNSPTEKF